MKKFYGLFFIIISTLVFSQNYHFDYLIKYLSVNKTTGFQDSGIVLINSNDHSYKGDLYAISKGDFITFIIRDKKGEVMHNYEIPRKASPNLASNYKYKSSDYHIPNESTEKSQKASHFEETVLSKDENGKKILLKKFRNEKSKKPEIVLTADYVGFDVDLRAFNFDHLFSVDANNLTLPDTEKSFIKHAEWKIDKISGEYNAEVFKFDLNLEIKPGEARLPKEKPVRKVITFEELKENFLEQQRRN